MIENFLPDEPICKSKNVLGEAAALEAILDLWRSVLDQGVVLACFQKDSDELVGLNMVCVITKQDVENFERSDQKHNIWKAVHDFALQKFDLFSHYKFADKILIAYGLSVSKKYRKLGIATEILKSRIPLCRALEIPLTSTVFTHLGSQKPAERVGFEVNYELSYGELKDVLDFESESLATNKLKLMSLAIT